MREIENPAGKYAAYILLLGVVVAAVISRCDDGAADSSDYPKIMQALNDASPELREEMLRSWAMRASPVNGLIGKEALDKFLRDFGYCSPSATEECKALPSGSVAQGEAIERLLILSGPYRDREPSSVGGRPQ